MEYRKVKNTEQECFVFDPHPSGGPCKATSKREVELNRNTEDKIKIVEKGGLKIKDILGYKNPFKTLSCNAKTCPLCTESKYVNIQSKERKISCRTNNVGYKGTLKGVRR